MHSTEGSAQSGFSIAVFALAVLSLLAAGISGYLAWSGFTMTAAAGCGPGSSCDAVLSSRWSMWFGLPISLFAMALYLTIAGAAVSLMLCRTPRRQRRAWAWLVLLISCAAGAAVWYIALQEFVVQAYCPWCLAVHCNALLCVMILLYRLPLDFSGKPPDDATPPTDSPRIRPTHAGTLVIVGLAMTITVATTQYLYSQSPGKRIITVLSDEQNIALDLFDYPVLTEAGLQPEDAAEHVIVFSDYTCPHCRDSHAIIKQARESHADDTAWIIAIVPLSEECNPNIERTHFVAKHACDYARLAMAVWVHAPDAFEQLHGWLFDGPTPPKLDEVRAKVASTLGVESLDAVLNDPRVTAQLDRQIALSEKLRAYRMPTFVLNGSMFQGPPRTPGQFKLWLHDAKRIGRAIDDSVTPEPNQPGTP